MTTISNHVPSNVPEALRYNYQSNVDGATLRSLTQLCCNNPNSADATIVLYLTLNSGDSGGNNNTVGWRGDSKNADVFLDTRPLYFPPGNFAVDINSFFDGIYAGYGVLSLWLACANFSNVQVNWFKNRIEIVKA